MPTKIGKMMLDSCPLAPIAYAAKLEPRPQSGMVTVTLQDVGPACPVPGSATAQERTALITRAEEQIHAGNTRRRVRTRDVGATRNHQITAATTSPGFGLPSVNTGQELAPVVAAVVLPPAAGAAGTGVLAVEAPPLDAPVLAIGMPAAAGVAAAAPPGHVLITVSVVGRGVGVAPTDRVGVPMKIGTRTAVSCPVTAEIAYAAKVLPSFTVGMLTVTL